MEIKKLSKPYSKYLDLLYIGDEDLEQIQKYIDLGIIYGLFVEGNLIGLCLIIEIDNDTLEIKNLAIYKEYQSQGYGTILMSYIIRKYKDDYKNIIVGTGDSMVNIDFYEKLGFIYSHKIDNFFKDNYKEEIIENNIVLKDMIYLKLKK